MRFAALVLLILAALALSPQVRNSSNRDNTYGAWVYFSPDFTVTGGSVNRFCGPVWEWSATEADVEVPVLETGQVAAFHIAIDDAQQPDGDMVITLRSNGADLPCSVTIPAGSPWGWYSAATCEGKVIAGQTWDVKAVNASAFTTILHRVAILFR